MVGLQVSMYFTEVGNQREFAKHGITVPNPDGSDSQLLKAYNESMECKLLTLLNWISGTGFYFFNPIFGFQFLRILLSKIEKQA